LTDSVPKSAVEETSPSRFQVYKPSQKSAQEVPPEHRRHIEELAARYSQRTAGSKQYTQQHRSVLADPRAASGFRSEWKEMVYPLVVVRSQGAKLWDLDGNEYIDLVNGYGQTAFGHAPQFVVQAVKEQLDRGFAIGSLRYLPR
jgi:4-aminobutyrate aminotransferase-like enzyme